MKTLLLLRHAKSSWKDTLLGDHDRPLNGRGRDEAPLVGEYLRQHGLTPAFVAVSTARRAVQTAAEALSVIQYHGLVRTSRQLYLAEEDELFNIISRTPKRYPSLMVVAHNPGLEQLLEQLTGEFLPMPTSCLAHIELAIETWREMQPDGSGKLVDLWRPATKR
ncbi:MAG: histidine phosphatase family protein [Anaerolineales bacterium]